MARRGERQHLDKQPADRAPPPSASEGAADELDRILTPAPGAPMALFSAKEGGSPLDMGAIADVAARANRVAPGTPALLTAPISYGTTIQEIKALSDKYRGIDLTKDYEAGRVAIGHLRRLRTGVEERRVQLKAPALEYSRDVDASAKELTAAISAIEDPLAAQKKAIDAAAERARIEAEVAAARAAEEEERKARAAEEEKRRLEREAEEKRLADQKREQDAETARIRAEAERVAAEARRVEDAARDLERRQEEERIRKRVEETARKRQEEQDRARQAELDARERALAEKEAAAATPPPPADCTDPTCNGDHDASDYRLSHTPRGPVVAERLIQTPAEARAAQLVDVEIAAVLAEGAHAENRLLGFETPAFDKQAAFEGGPTMMAFDAPTPAAAATAATLADDNRTVQRLAQQVLAIVDNPNGAVAMCITADGRQQCQMAFMTLRELAAELDAWVNDNGGA